MLRILEFAIHRCISLPFFTPGHLRRSRHASSLVSGCPVGLPLARCVRANPGHDYRRSEGFDRRRHSRRHRDGREQGDQRDAHDGRPTRSGCSTSPRCRRATTPSRASSKGSRPRRATSSCRCSRPRASTSRSRWARSRKRRRSPASRAAGRDGECDGRHRHREPAHRRAAAERPQLSQLIALSPNVSAEFAGAGQAGDRQGGSRANQQLSISGQRREFNYYTLDGVDNTDVNFNTYIFLPSVDALEEFKVQTGIYSAEFGRAASQVNVVTKSGIELLPRHGVRVPPQRRVRRPPVRVHGRAGRGAEAAVQVESVPATPRAARSLKNRLFFMSNFEGYKDRKTVPEPLHRADGGDAGRRFLELLANLGRSTRRPVNEPASSSTRPGARGRHVADRASRSRATDSRRAACTPISQQLLEFYPGAERRRQHADEQLPVAPGSRDRQVPVHAAHRLRPELAVDLDGPLQLRPGRRGDAGVEVERHEAATTAFTRSMIGNTLDAVADGASTSSASASTPSSTRSAASWPSCATWSRSSAFPASSTARPRPGAFRPSASPGSAASATAPKGPTPTGTRCSSSPTTCRGFAAATRSRSAAASATTCTTRSGNQFARGEFQFDSATDRRLALRAFADFLLGYTQQSESAVALAVTKFRALSQAYYFTDTWRVRANMTLDLGLRYEYTPPWLDKGGTLMNASLPYHDTTPSGGLVAPSGAGAHRQRRLLRGLADPVRAEHPDGARRPSWAIA